MRATLTLDEDVAAGIKAEVRRSGRPFRMVINELLRIGLLIHPAKRSAEPPFEVHARDLGPLRPGLTLDHIGNLIEVAEGPLHR